MRIVYIILACCTLATVSCKNSNTTSNKSAASQVVNRPPVKSALNDTDTKLLMQVVADYYSLKNAMVASNAAKISDAVNPLIKSAGRLDTVLHGKYNTDDTLTMLDVLRPYIDTIIRQSMAITYVTDPTCEKQRLVFGTLSSAMYGLLKKTQVKNAGIYQEFCPMAYNEKGAYWLSDESEIKNPYFGKKMLECGEVTDSL